MALRGMQPAPPCRRLSRVAPHGGASRLVGGGISATLAATPDVYRMKAEINQNAFTYDTGFDAVGRTCVTLRTLKIRVWASAQPNPTQPDQKLTRTRMVCTKAQGFVTRSRRCENNESAEKKKKQDGRYFPLSVCHHTKYHT